MKSTGSPEAASTSTPGVHNAIFPLIFLLEPHFYSRQRAAYLRTLTIVTLGFNAAFSLTTAASAYFTACALHPFFFSVLLPLLLYHKISVKK